MLREFGSVLILGDNGIIEAVMSNLVKMKVLLEERHSFVHVHELQG